MSVLCTHCNNWVKCTPHEKARIREPYGFCITEYLFTYTAKDKCKDFVEGKPMSEEEWEEAQRL